MGGKGGGSGGGTTTVNSNQSPPPQVLQAYQNVVNQAQNVAGQPLQQYTGPMIAGFTPAQMQSMQTVNNAQGVANPYINAAAQYAGQSATPITPTQFSAGQVQQYLNPYTQNVVNATQAQFNNQNQQQANQLAGQSISQGAFGGDREAIAQAELANQQQLAQAPVIAGLNQSNYSQALGEFNTQQQVGVGAQEATGWLGSNAGYALGNLGNEALNTQLTGASAQLQSGALQQQLAQEELNIPYEMFQQQQGYPFQTTNFLAGITEGVGGLEGGTSSTTSPTASSGSQAAGLGIAGLGALGASGAFGSSGGGSGWLSGLFSSGAAAAANRGGRVARADGGLTGFDQTDAADVNQMMMLAGESPIPLPNDAGHNTLPAAPAPNALAGLGPDPSSSSSSDSGGGGWGGALEGGATGAVEGGMIGGPYGAIAGGVIGALVGGLSNRGGRVGRGSGGSLPGIPDVSISYVPSVATAGGGRGNGLPGSPKPVNNNSPSPLSDLQQGIAFGKLFNNGSGGNGSIANSPSNVPGVGTNSTGFGYTGQDLAASGSFDAARSGGGAYGFGAADSGALADAFVAARGGRLRRDAGGPAAISPLIAGFTDAPGRPGISIPVLGPGPSGMGPSGMGASGTGASGTGGVGGGTAGFAVPVAPIGTNVAGTPAPAGQLDINPVFNWSPPNPNSLSHVTFNPPALVAPTPPPGSTSGTGAGSGGQSVIDMNSSNGGPGGGGGPAGNGTGADAGGSGPSSGGNSAGNDGSDGAADGGTGGNGGEGNAWRGGTVPRHHRDMGGNILASGAQSAGQPIGGGNPLVAQQYQQLAQLPTEKLMELAQRVPPTTPQGAVIQRAVIQRKMNPSSAPQQQQQAGFAQAPSPYGTFAGGQPLQQPMMARGGVAGFRRAYADGGDPSQTVEPMGPPQPTQAQNLSGMSNEDLVSAQNNPNYSPSLVGREMESRGIRTGWGNLVHSIGSGFSNVGSHFRDAAAAGPPDAVTPEQAAAGAQTTADAARGVGDWFTKPIIPTQPAPPAMAVRRDDPRVDVKGGDPSLGGVAPRPLEPVEPRNLHDGDQPVARPVSGFAPAEEAAPPYPQTKPAPPPPRGLVPVSWTNPDTNAPAEQRWVNPDNGKVVPSPQPKPSPSAPAESARPVPPSGGAVGAPTSEPKTAGFQPARANPEAGNTSRNFSQNPWLAVVNAGAAMAAGRSPSWMANAAAGIQAGTATLGEQAKFDQTERFKKAETDARNRGYDLEAQKLGQALQIHKESLAEEHEFHGTTAAHQAKADETAAQRAAITDRREQDYQQRIIEQGGRPSYIGPSTDPDHPGSVMIGRRPDGTIGTYIDPVQVGAKTGQDTTLMKNARYLTSIGLFADEKAAAEELRQSVNDPLKRANLQLRIEGGFRGEIAANPGSPLAGMSEAERHAEAARRLNAMLPSASTAQPAGAPGAASQPSTQASQPPPIQTTFEGKPYDVLEDANKNHAIKVGDKYVPVILQNGTWVPAPQ